MKKNRLLILSSVLAVFILVGPFVIIFGQIGMLKGINSSLTRINKDLKGLQADIRNKDNYIKEKDSLQVEVKDIGTRFLSKGDASLVMSEINNISKELNLKILNMKAENLSRMDGGQDAEFYYLPISLSLNASFNALGAFLNKLEKVNFFLELRSLEIKGEYPDTTASMIVCGIAKG